MTHDASPSASSDDHDGFSRRVLLAGGLAAATGAVALPLVRRFWKERAPVFLAAGQRYDGDLEQTVADGLVAVGVDPPNLRGRNVLLKPNLVEPTRDAPHMTTHPAVVLAVAEVFRRWGAQVRVGEGPGHVRDTELALVESGMSDALDAAGLEFVDLNYEETQWTKNIGRASKLEGFHFPRAVVEADLVVSLPKLKTHHWVGMTNCMKNFYGVLPGIKYGWPKNVLHHAGIPETVIDINASLPPVLAVVDGIVCMEGDGPIMGTAKPLGLIAVGCNLPALDATCARIMQLNPYKIPYLRLAENRLGPLDDWGIEQRGQKWRELSTPFELLDKPHLQDMLT